MNGIEGHANCKDRRSKTGLSPFLYSESSNLFVIKMVCFIPDLPYFFDLK